MKTIKIDDVEYNLVPVQKPAKFHIGDYIHRYNSVGIWKIINFHSDTVVDIIEMEGSANRYAISLNDYSLATDNDIIEYLKYKHDVNLKVGDKVYVIDDKGNKRLNYVFTITDLKIRTTSTNNIILYANTKNKCDHIQNTFIPTQLQLCSEYDKLHNTTTAFNSIEKYIQDGIRIEGNPKDGYTVFTCPTQHFKIKSLQELTVERFEEAIKAQKELQHFEDKMMELTYGEYGYKYGKYCPICATKGAPLYNKTNIS